MVDLNQRRLNRRVQAVGSFKMQRMPPSAGAAATRPEGA
jgi:hypothetical protein